MSQEIFQDKLVPVLYIEYSDILSLNPLNPPFHRGKRAANQQKGEFQS